jgi:hypothetical protein
MSAVATDGSARAPATYLLMRSAQFGLYATAFSAPILLLLLGIAVWLGGAPAFLVVPVISAALPIWILRENRALAERVTLTPAGIEARTILHARRWLAWTDVVGLEWASGPIRGSRTLKVIGQSAGSSIWLWGDGFADAVGLFEQVRAFLPNADEVGRPWSPERARDNSGQARVLVLTLLLLLVAFVSGVGACVVANQSPVAPLQELTPVSGTVTSVTLGGTRSPNLTMNLSGQASRFSVARAPNQGAYEAMVAQVRAGQSATVWVSPDDYRRARAVIPIWQLSIDGNVVLSYADLAGSWNQNVEANQRGEPWALGLFAAAVFGLNCSARQVPPCHNTLERCQPSTRRDHAGLI